MSEDHEAEIRASVAAHRDLGSGYDEAVAEGLVERIGAEIDKRIDARLGNGTAYPQPPFVQAPAYPPVFGSPARPPVVPPTVPPGPPQRPLPPSAQHAASPVVVLGSMGLGVAATAIVTGENSGHGPIAGQVFMIALIWVAIAVINVVYARRR